MSGDVAARRRAHSPPERCPRSSSLYAVHRPRRTTVGRAHLLVRPNAPKSQSYQSFLDTTRVEMFLLPSESSRGGCAPGFCPQLRGAASPPPGRPEPGARTYKSPPRTRLGGQQPLSCRLPPQGRVTALLATPKRVRCFQHLTRFIYFRCSIRGIRMQRNKSNPLDSEAVLLRSPLSQAPPVGLCKQRFQWGGFPSPVHLTPSPSRAKHPS